MSYVVSVVRDTPIENAELEALAKDAAAFDFETSDGYSILHWHDPESEARESFVLTDGALDITTPSDAALAAAQELANVLGAQVVGEEGEDLTDVEPAGDVTTSTGCGPMTATLAIIGLLLAAYWLFA